MKLRIVFASAALLLTLSCATVFHVSVPGGFALVEEGERFLAVSPEGLRFRVRQEENYPQKDVDFWSGALKRQLEEEGYHPGAGGDFFECPAGRGFYIEWNVPYGGETYTYMTGIVPSGDTIYLAEAAAEHTIYAAYQEEIVKSLESISSE